MIRGVTRREDGFIFGGVTDKDVVGHFNYAPTVEVNGLERAGLFLSALNFVKTGLHSYR